LRLSLESTVALDCHIPLELDLGFVVFPTSHSLFPLPQSRQAGLDVGSQLQSECVGV
jgi:hypothetical protein